MKSKEISERALIRHQAVVDMRREGMTYPEIASMFGLTPVRIRQMYIKAERIYVPKGLVK